MAIDGNCSRFIEVYLYAGQDIDGCTRIRRCRIEVNYATMQEVSLIWLRLPFVRVSNSRLPAIEIDIRITVSLSMWSA